LDCDADAGSVLSSVSPVFGLVVRPLEVNASPLMARKKRRPVRELSVASRMATNWFMISGMLQKIIRSATRSGPLKHFFSTAQVPKVASDSAKCFSCVCAKCGFE